MLTAEHHWRLTDHQGAQMTTAYRPRVTNVLEEKPEVHGVLTAAVSVGKNDPE